MTAGHATVAVPLDEERIWVGDRVASEFGERTFDDRADRLGHHRLARPLGGEDDDLARGREAYRIGEQVEQRLAHPSLVGEEAADIRRDAELELDAVLDEAILHAFGGGIHGPADIHRTEIERHCTGVDGGNCNRCSNGAPICPGAVGAANTCPADEQRNRWTTAIEVLTGTIQNFSCVALQRTQNTIYTYDYLYPVEWHQPMSNGVPLWDPASAQSTDGILDSYADRVRFGLMTFDNDYRTGIGSLDGMFSVRSTSSPTVVTVVSSPSSASSSPALPQAAPISANARTSAPTRAETRVRMTSPRPPGNTSGPTPPSGPVLTLVSGFAERQ